MSTFRRIGTGCLVGLVFAAGYAARLQNMAREEAYSKTVRRAPSAPGTQIASAGLESAGSIDLRPLEVMLTILKSLREHYVDPVTPQEEGKMTHDSLRAMLASLGDPNTRFVDPDQRKLIADAAEGNFHGIGAILAVKRIKTGEITEEHLVVVTPIESGPAAKAGLRPGDDIVAINDKAVLPFNPYLKATEILKQDRKKAVERSEMRKHIESEQKRIDNGIPMLEAEKQLGSEESKDVELSVVRKGSPKEIKVKITPREFEVTPVASTALDDGKLGYIKVNCFSNETGEQFQSAVRDLAGNKVKGLIVDLRNIAAGDLTPITEVAKPLMARRTLAVEVMSHNRRSQVKIGDYDTENSWRGPLVVLVNGGTAKMAEVLAAGLRESASAKLVGEKTYGDFSQVTLIDEKDGSAVAMTTGKFITLNGKDYNAKGLPVDVAVADGTGDPQIKAAVKLLTAGGKG